MTKRFKTVCYVFLAWILVQIMSWALNSWLDTYVTQSNLGAALQVTANALSYLGGNFGFGFVVGSFLFSMRDWPLIGQWIRRLKEKLRNKEADEALAQKCDEISKFLYEQAAAAMRLSNDNFWARSGDHSREDYEKVWRDSRAADAREEERIRRQVGPKVQDVLIALGEHGVKMDLWGLSLDTHGLHAASYFFAELASSLRSGTYLDRQFTANRVGLPARM